MTRRICLVVFLFLVPALIGCVGARPTIGLDSAKYPVSMSGIVLDSDGEPLRQDEQVPVGRFKAEKVGYAMGYSYIQLNTVDFSEELNRQVAEVDGQAVVNFEVKKIFSPCTFLHVAQVTQALPVCVGCSKIAVEGNIIRSKKSP